MTTTEHLVTTLESVGILPVAWRGAFLAVPRHRFLPTQIWTDDDDGDPQPIDRDTDPDRWLASAYSNVAIVTQFDDGATVWPDVGVHRTSSASEPGMVATMLDHLEVQDGHRILEIGTGTGYNAPLLAHRLTASRITTVEIDPVIAGLAKTAWTSQAIPLPQFSVREHSDGGHALPTTGLFPLSPHTSASCRMNGSARPPPVELS